MNIINISRETKVSSINYLPAPTFEVVMGHTPECDKMDQTVGWIADNRDMLEKFIEFASNKYDAVGLAANQVSFNDERLTDRFFAMECDGNWILVINPTIDVYGGERNECKEGCLSFPGCTLSAIRNTSIEVSYWTINGDHVKGQKLKRFNAQIFQHEIDHLNGVEEKIVSNDHFTYRRVDKKVGRNEPCPCGSGKKYKKCCG